MTAYVSASRRRARHGAVLSVVIAMLAIAGLCWAGNYLDRCFLIVRQATEDSEYLQNRLGNRELARYVHKMAEARLGAAREMTIPSEVTQAHPHLLLMLENLERASDAAVDGEADRFVTYYRRARDEEEIFRSILRQLGFSLPDEAKKK
jgi:hypothetical protein